MASLFAPEPGRTTATLLVLALIIGGGSFFRCLNIERAMRKNRLPLPWIAPILASGGALVAAVMVIFVLVGTA